eukprot:gene21744-26153_t
MKSMASQQQKGFPILVFLVVVTLPVCDGVSWGWVDSDYVPTNNLFLDIFTMQSYQTAWAVGEYDTVVKSVDRGDTWYEVQTGVGGVGQHWYSVAFYNSTHGWIVGAYGKVIYTNGGGETGSWIEQFSDVSQVVGTGTRPAYGAFLYDIQILDGGVALMVGQSGNIRRTYNWGETWEEVEALASYDFLALHFVTALRGWVVGDCGERILYTEDGGDTWSWQFPSEFLDDTGQFEQRLLLNDILFISDNVGFAVGREGRMLRTDHGGIDFSWHYVESCTSYALYSIALDPLSGEGFIVGNERVTCYSVDNGTDWSYLMVLPGQGGSLSAVSQWGSDNLAQAAGDFGWVVGSYGTAIRTSDGGMSTWTLLETGVQPTLMLYGVVAVNSSTVFAVGDANTIIRSTDGGNTWVHQNSRTRSMAFKAVYFVNESTGYVVGYNE